MTEQEQQYFERAIKAETKVNFLLAALENIVAIGLYDEVYEIAKSALMDIKSNIKCPLPPEGWECSRKIGHEEPCVASPVKTLIKHSSPAGPYWYHPDHPLCQDGQVLWEFPEDEVEQQVDYKTV